MPFISEVWGMKFERGRSVCAIVDVITTVVEKPAPNECHSVVRQSNPSAPALEDRGQSKTKRDTPRVAGHRIPIERDMVEPGAFRETKNLAERSVVPT